MAAIERTTKRLESLFKTVGIEGLEAKDVTGNRQTGKISLWNIPTCRVADRPDAPPTIKWKPMETFHQLGIMPRDVPKFKDNMSRKLVKAS